jgi:hypothetical protein
MALALLLLAGCGQKTNINPNVQKYFTQFEVLYGKRLKPVETEFNPLGTEAIAKCRTKYEPITGHVLKRTIVIDMEQLNNLDCEKQKTAVIWHEILHCELNRKHVPLGLKSFMEPNVYSCEYYEANWQILINEMFN